MNMPFRGCVALCCTLLAALPAAVRAQVAPPDVALFTIESEHLRITYPRGLEELARAAARSGEAAWQRLAQSVARPPDPPVDVLLTDHIDISNGFANTHPSNRIVIYARPPADDRELGWFNDWMNLVVSHELTHIFHLDAAGAVGRAIRTVFGRVPMRWPAFPARETPAWSIEGVAVDLESDYTGFGRIHGSWHEMVVRTAILGNRFDPYERASSVSPIWPGGQRVYVYGSLFLEYLQQLHGEEMPGLMVSKIASSILPTHLLFGTVGVRTIGSSFGTAWREWHSSLEAHYAAFADSIRDTGLTNGTRATQHGRFAFFPRISPDGTRLAWNADDGRRANATRILDLGTGRRLHTWRRNGRGAFAWLPDGSGVIVSQLEFDGPWHIRQDLWIRDARGERRITHAARLQDPDIARSGRIVAIENLEGTNRPVLVDMQGEVRSLVDARPDALWSYPRWAPEGTRIALSRWSRGAYAIVVIDTLGQIIDEIPDEGIATTPAWAPDGNTLFWSSDRSGITNLYAAGVARNRVMQVTNVLTGAFMPEISPDGRTIWYSAYAADGFHIESIPYDTASWREPAPARMPLRAQAPPADDGAPPDVQLSEPRSWSPLPTALPKYWSPFISARGEAGDFVGIETAGRDLVGRHVWDADVSIDPNSGRWAGSFGWTNARLGMPIIDLQVARTWDDAGAVRLEDETLRPVIGREDAIAAFAIFPLPRWRTSTQFSLGLAWERDSRSILRAPQVRLADPRDDLFSVLGGFGFANYQVNDLSISREDGIALSLAGRVSRERDPHPEFPADYEETSGQLSLYRALPLGGFARPVLALRGSALRRFGEGALPTSIGGASGGVYDVLGLLDIGDGALLLPVRGFDRGVRAGTRAWTASAELRVPVAIPGKRLPLTPLYFDRISLSFFGDAGDASCSAAEAERSVSCERANAAGGPLLSTGIELVTDLGIGSWFYTRLRTGVAQPLQGPGDVKVYVRVGSAF